jgi:uncharacterized Zn-binding protein involved in type VI secretion
MRQAAAKRGDQILPQGPHIHAVQVGNAISQLPFPCVWKITESLSNNVNIEGKPAATVGSGGDNSGGASAHQPAPGSRFVSPPPGKMDKAAITQGSSKVFINRKQAARNGGLAETCNEPVGAASGTVVVAGACKVWIGE